MFCPRQQEELSDYAQESRWNMASSLPPALQSLREASQQHVRDQSEKHMDLSTNLRASNKPYSAERTFQKPEKQLNRPSRLVEGCNRRRCEIKAVGEKLKLFPFLGAKSHKPQVVHHLGGSGSQADDLVGDNAELSMLTLDLLFLDNPVGCVALEASHKEDAEIDHVIEKGVNVVSPVDNVSPTLLQEDFKVVAIVNLPSGEDNLRGDTVGDVESHVRLDSIDRLAVLSPKLLGSTVQDCRVYGGQVAELRELSWQLLGEAEHEVLEHGAQYIQSQRTVHGIRESAQGNFANPKTRKAVRFLDSGAHRGESEAVVEEPAQDHGEDRKHGEPASRLFFFNCTCNCLLQGPEHPSKNRARRPWAAKSASFPFQALSVKLRTPASVSLWPSNSLVATFTLLASNGLDLRWPMRDTLRTHSLFPSDKCCFLKLSVETDFFIRLLGTNLRYQNHSKGPDTTDPNH